MQDILVIRPPVAATADVLGRMPWSVPPACRIATMSNGGRHLNLAQAGHEPAHLFAHGSTLYDAIVIAREFRLLYANDFTRAWLASLFARLRPGGRLWWEVPASATGNWLLDPAGLQAALPELRCRVAVSGLFELTAGRADLERRWRTIFADAQASYPEFRTRFAAAAANFEGHWLKVGQEEQQYIYAMMGANQKSWLAENALGARAAQPCRILDVGGGFGHFAAEMARKGHFVTLAEVDPAKTRALGPWLAATCGVSAAVRFVEERMEAIQVAAESADLVTIFGSLLYAERAALANTIAKLWRALVPGGVLIVHENPRDAIDADAADYAYRFPARELDELLTRHAAAPRYIAPFTGAEIGLAKAASSVMIAVSRKSDSYAEVVRA